MKKILLLIIIFLAFETNAFAASKLECVQGGRYQYYEGVVPRVFDTRTGKIYLWFPHDKKTGEDPHIAVQDPVNGKGKIIKIDWSEDPGAR